MKALVLVHVAAIVEHAPTICARERTLPRLVMFLKLALVTVSSEMRPLTLGKRFGSFPASLPSAAPTGPTEFSF